MDSTFEQDAARKVLRLNARILVLETQNAALTAALRDLGVTEDEITQILESSLLADDPADDSSQTTTDPASRG